MSGSAQVIKNMYAWAQALKFGAVPGFPGGGIEGVARVTAANMTNYAKQRVVSDHVWIPRTGAAHGGLHGGVIWENIEVLKVYIAHAVSYGIMLELAHDRKHAILEESRDKFAQDFYNGIKRIMGV